MAQLKGSFTPKWLKTHNLCFYPETSLQILSLEPCARCLNWVCMLWWCATAWWGFQRPGLHQMSSMEPFYVFWFVFFPFENWSPLFGRFCNTVFLWNSWHEGDWIFNFGVNYPFKDSSAKSSIFPRNVGMFLSAWVCEQCGDARLQTADVYIKERHRHVISRVTIVSSKDEMILDSTFAVFWKQTSPQAVKHLNRASWRDSG